MAANTYVSVCAASVAAPAKRAQLCCRRCGAENELHSKALQTECRVGIDIIARARTLACLTDLLGSASHRTTRRAACQHLGDSQWADPLPEVPT